MDKKIPAVSVVIPMYNSEKFIEPCLKSILNQKFKDFEVIVVDDCSTDTSREIVEKYIQYFSDKGLELKLVKLKKNLGRPGIPRNKGLKLSRGKYIYFIDSDDLIISTALEKLYQTAESSAADVVFMCKYYIFKKDSEKPFPEKVELRNIYTKLTAEPEAESDQLNVRINDFFKIKLWVTPWIKFLRRDFLIEEEINFPHTRFFEDDFWTLSLLIRAKKIVCTANPYYIYRILPNSTSQFAHKSIEENVKSHMSTFILGMKFLCDLKANSEFLQENLKYWYSFVDYYTARCFNRFIETCSKLQPHEFYKMVLDSIDGESCDSKELIAILSAVLNSRQKNLYSAKQKISKLEKELSLSKDTLDVQ